MTTKNKIGLGSILAVFGGIGIVLGPSLGFTRLSEPWSFITGIIIGIIGGIGAVLSILGLLENRKSIIKKS